MHQKKRAMLVFAVLVAIGAVATPSAATAEPQRYCVTPDGWTVKLHDLYPQQSTDRCPGVG